MQIERVTQFEAEFICLRPVKLVLHCQEPLVPFVNVYDLYAYAKHERRKINDKITCILTHAQNDLFAVVLNTVNALCVLEGMRNRQSLNRKVLKG